MKGIDVSHWQVPNGTDPAHEVDVVLAAAAAWGARFVFLKVSEGLDYADPTAELWARGAHDLGLTVGAYHFAHADKGNAAAAEADWFWWWTSAQGLDPDVCILDIENHHPAGSGSAPELEWVDSWCGRATKHGGDVPFVYSFMSFWTSSTWATVGSRWPLWVARTSDLPPLAARWTVWQYGKEQLAGRDVDVDVWRER